MLNTVATPFFATIRRAVKSSFTKYLLFTNVSLSFVLSGTGDVLQQNFRIANQQQLAVDKARTKHMTVAGASTGFLCHYWYQFLDRKYPGRAMKIVLRKLFVDQIIFSPICICTVIITLNVLDKCSKSSSQKFGSFREEFSEKGWRLYLAEWVIWPPAQLVNFYYLPTRYRVLYDNVISLVYDTYTSHVCYDIKVCNQEDSSFKNRFVNIESSSRIDNHLLKTTKTNRHDNGLETVS